MTLPGTGLASHAYEPIVVQLQDYINSLGLTPSGQTHLDVAVDNAREPPMTGLMDLYGITNGDSFYDYANDLLFWTPTESFNSQSVYDVICAFYYVLDQSPLGETQNEISPTSVGKNLTTLSNWILEFSQTIGTWLSEPESLTPHGYMTFKASLKYKYEEWDEPNPYDPTGGFTSFNEFFSRPLKPGIRPVADPKNDTTIVFPADSSFDMSCPVEGNSTIPITVKGIPWNIQDLLLGSSYAKDFKNGVFMHAFLNTYNYHRQHAPVSGTVVEARIIQGAAYLDVQPTPDGQLSRRRRMGSIDKVFPDPGPTTPRPDAIDGTGYQFLQMRGCFIIDNPKLGLVAVLPIGMAQVSSIVPYVMEGSVVEKGDEISCFQFGGSDVVVVFQEKAGVNSSFQPPPPEPGRDYSLVNSLLTRAEPKS